MIQIKAFNGIQLQPMNRETQFLTQKLKAILMKEFLNCKKANY